MKVYCCQLDIAWENKPENYGRVSDWVRKSRPEPGSLFVLPEMFATGFSMNVAGIAEEASPGTMEFLREIARESGVYFMAGLVTRGPDGRGLNQSVVISPAGTELSRYTKIHPFSLAGELEHFSGGGKLESFEWGGLKVAPFICYDLRFPEIFRGAASGGAEMLVVIANWPSRREQHWVTLLQARAIENLAFVVGVNRAGKDPNHEYPGRSLIIDPHGNILADAGAGEGVIHAEIQREVVSEWRAQFPALKDMHWRG